MNGLISGEMFLPEFIIISGLAVFSAGLFLHWVLKK